MADEISVQSKLYYLLGNNYGLWKCNDADYYSFITPKIIIDKIIDLAKENFNGLSDKVIWDMFAGIGCDGLRIAKYAGKVICTELKEEHYADLAHNVQAMGMCNVETHLADCCKMTNTANIVYFDPPWGDSFRSGETFDFINVSLEDGTSVLNLAQAVSSDHHMIIKSPISSDSFEVLFGNRVIEVFTFTQQKLKFLFVRATNGIEY